MHLSKLVMGIIYYLLFDLKSIILSIEKNSWLENTIDNCFFVHSVLYSVLCPVQCTLSCTVYIVLEAGTKFAIDDLHADPYFKCNQTWDWSFPIDLWLILLVIICIHRTGCYPKCNISYFTQPFFRTIYEHTVNRYMYAAVYNPMK